MVSAFQSRPFGFGRLLSESELDDINFFRKSVRPNYLSEESALAINGNTDKPLLTNNSPFVKYFEVGVERMDFGTTIKWRFTPKISLIAVRFCIQHMTSFLYMTKVVVMPRRDLTVSL